MRFRVGSAALALAMLVVLAVATTAVRDTRSASRRQSDRAAAVVRLRAQGGGLAAAAVAALRRVGSASLAPDAVKLVAATDHEAAQAPDNLLLAGAAYDARRIRGAARRELAALSKFRPAAATAVVLNELAPAQDSFQRELSQEISRRNNMARRAATRADRAALAASTVIVIAGAAFALFWTALRRRADRQRFARTRASTFEALTRMASDALTVINGQCDVQGQAGATDRIFGAAGQSMVGRPFISVVHPDDRVLLGELHRTGVVEWRVGSQEQRWLDVETRITDLRGDPNVGALVLTSRDVSERKHLERELVRRATHDPLTGLLNRSTLHHHLATLLESAAARGSVAVLYIDLDDFKAINDVHGHNVGDEVLRATSERLLAAVRHTDLVARLGGDEFVVVLHPCADALEPERVARRILHAFGRTVPTAAGDIAVGLSIGSGAATEDDRDPVALLHRVDRAMYRAKSRGKGCCEQTAQADIHRSSPPG